MNSQAATVNQLGLANQIALVGHHNVGKSVLFTLLTGRQTITANYPGTTVEIIQGEARFDPGTTVVDTPGVITLPSRTEDEHATTRVLLDSSLKSIIQVGDAKNLRRTLLLTMLLAEMGIPLILVLNMMDEAQAHGIRIDHRRLSELLDIPVVPMTATRRHGFQDLKKVLEGRQNAPQFHLSYPLEIEKAIEDLQNHLPEAPFSGRALALLWLSGDIVVTDWLTDRLDKTTLAWMIARREQAQETLEKPISTVIQYVRIEYLQRLIPAVELSAGTGWHGFGAQFGHFSTHPIWGLPILGAVLYALYWFVGVFGAGTLVDYLETSFFGELLNPWVTDLVTRLVPVPLIADFLVGEFGLWTMGMTYALALILPIVTTFFLAFGVLEDSGYLPRLAVLTNRLFQMMGLNGKAVVPMVLGLGCVTMATLTTRILETRRERLLAILLLALAVPCSAQLGVIMGLLASTSFTATLIWGGAILAVLLFIGWLSTRLIPGKRRPLMIEIPPIRRPVLATVLLKTLARLEWYLKEVVPLF